MDSYQEISKESKKYYNQFLTDITSSLNKSFDNTLSDPRANLIELCYCQALSFPSWRQILSKNNGFRCEELYNEIQSDLTISISSAVTGNYRLALMSIRSFIEMSMLFAYYYNHPIEYQWWLSGNHVIKFSELQANYFNKYSQLNLYKINETIFQEWKRMSKYIHAEFKEYMQSSNNLPFLPTYQKGKLGQWINHFCKGTQYVNEFFYVLFQEEYFQVHDRIEFANSCQIIKQNLNNEHLFLNVQQTWKNKTLS